MSCFFFQKKCNNQRHTHIHRLISVEKKGERVKEFFLLYRFHAKKPLTANHSHLMSQTYSPLGPRLSAWFSSSAAPAQLAWTKGASQSRGWTAQTLRSTADPFPWRISISGQCESLRCSPNESTRRQGQASHTSNQTDRQVTRTVARPPTQALEHIFLEKALHWVRKPRNRNDRAVSKAILCKV